MSHVSWKITTCNPFMALKNWHALKTWPSSLNANFFPCRRTTLTVGPASNIKSHKNGVFSFVCNLDLFVLLEVQICLMFAIRLKCKKLAIAELALWSRLELGLRCLPCERLKTRGISALTFYWVGWVIFFDNNRTSSRSWRICRPDCCAILPDSSERRRPESDERISLQSTLRWQAVTHRVRKTNR